MKKRWAGTMFLLSLLSLFSEILELGLVKNEEKKI